jgi:uncharacterized membrane protein
MKLNIRIIFVIYAAVQYAILPILFPFDLFLWFWFLAQIFIYGFFIYTNVKKGTIPAFLATTYYKVAYRFKKKDIYGLIGLTTTFWGILMSLYFIGYAASIITKIPFIALITAFIFLYLMYNSKIVNFVWNGCTELAIKVSHIYILGFIIPIALEFGLDYLNTNLLVKVSQDNMSVLVMMVVYMMQLFFGALFYLTLDNKE